MTTIKDDTCAEALETWQQGIWQSSTRQNTIKMQQDQFVSDQMTIASLRAIITELTKTLQAADANARISITSSELLELIHHNEDRSDTPF